MIALCFGCLLLFDFVVVYVLMWILDFFGKYMPATQQTGSYTYFVTQLSGVGGILLYIVFYIISIIASTSLLKDEIKNLFKTE